MSTIEPLKAPFNIRFSLTSPAWKGQELTGVMRFAEVNEVEVCADNTHSKAFESCLAGCHRVSDAPMWDGFVCLDCRMARFDFSNMSGGEEFVAQILHEISHIIAQSFEEEPGVGFVEAYAALTLFGTESSYTQHVLKYQADADVGPEPLYMAAYLWAHDGRHAGERESRSAAIRAVQAAARCFEEPLRDLDDSLWIPEELSRLDDEQRILSPHGGGQMDENMSPDQVREEIDRIPGLRQLIKLCEREAASFYAQDLDTARMQMLLWYHKEGTPGGSVLKDTDIDEGILPVVAGYGRARALMALKWHADHPKVRRHLAYVLHSPYGDRTWRGMEKCCSTKESDGPLIFLTREDAETYLSSHGERIDPYFEVVPVVIETPSIRKALNAVKERS